MKTKSNQTKIAVIGMSCQYPGAKNIKELWENILSRRQQFRRMPDCRLPLNDYFDPDKSVEDKTYGKRASVIDGFNFDWKKYRIPKRAYESTDIVHWLALEVAIKAVEDAGYSRENVPTEKTGVIIGNSLTGEFTRSNTLRQRWPFFKKVFSHVAERSGLGSHEIETFSRSLEYTFKSVFFDMTEDSLAGGLSNTISGRICNFFDFHGGGYTVDGACSSSILSVITAVKALALGDMDLALAGGVDISLDTFELVGFAKTGALTHGDMNVYDKKGKGFIPGEGCGVVVLKRYEDAVRDGNKIYAIIEGTGISSDGKGGITAPSIDGQTMALKRARTEANYSVESLDFIEGHGTGTAVGDKVELCAISKSFELNQEMPLRGCGVTSLKSLIGHAKAAAGIGAFIKAVLAVNQRVLPPTCGCDTPHEVFSKEAQYLYPILQGKVFSKDKEMKAGISAMGFGGINGHVLIKSNNKKISIIENDLDELSIISSHQNSEIFILSGNNTNDIIKLTQYIKFESTHMSLAELSDFSAKLCKNVSTNHEIRVAIIAISPQDLHDKTLKLEEYLKKGLSAKEELISIENDNIFISNKLKKQSISFIYPGQSAQKLNMTKKIMDRFPWARKMAVDFHFELKKHGFPHFIETYIKDLDRAKDSNQIKSWFQDLSQTHYAQCSVVLSSLIWTKFLSNLGIRPQSVGGHSLGELMSFYTAGGIGQDELIQITALRGALMSKSKAKGTMLLLKCDLQKANEIINTVSNYAVIANLNTPTEIIVSGSMEGINEVEKTASTVGVTTIRIPVSNAFHSKYMDDASNHILEMSALNRYFLSKDIDIYSGVTGNIVDENINIIQYFSQQIKSPVNFIKLAQSINKNNNIFIEVGAGSIATKMLIANGIDRFKCFSTEDKINDEHSLHRLLATLFCSGHQIQWNELFAHRLIREYVDFKNKSFITNPLERELKYTDEKIAFGHNSGFNINNISNNHLKDYVVDFINKITQQSPQIENLNTNSLELTKDLSVPIQNDRNLSDSILETIQELTGFSKSDLTDDLKLLDDLNIDSIKSAELVASLTKKLNITDHIDHQVYSNFSIGELKKDFIRMSNTINNVAYPSNQSSQITNNIDQIIDSIIEGLTGLERSDFTDDMKLLDDLNLDSIKSAEFVLLVKKEMNIDREVEPIEVSNKSLKEIKEYFNRIKHSTNKEINTVSIKDNLSTNKAETLPHANSNHIDSAIYKYLEEITGFDKEAFSDDLKLLDDLNIDSIKIAEFSASLKNKLDIKDDFDFSRFSSFTIGEVRESLTNELKEDAKILSINQNIISTNNNDINVKCYVLEQRPEPCTTISNIYTKLVEQNFIIISHAGNNNDILNSLKEKGISATGISFIEFESNIGNLINSNIIIDLSHISRASYLNLDLAQMVKILSTTAQVIKKGIRSLCIIQYGERLFAENYSPISLMSCNATSFLASVHHENPQLPLKVIDFNVTLKPSFIATKILEEISNNSLYSSSSYQNDGNRYLFFPQVFNREVQSPRSFKVNSSDIILVTGGGKGITAECAFHLALESKAKMILLGTSEHPSTSFNSEISETLNRYKSSNLHCEYIKCDITDISSVRNIVEYVETKHGKITGVIHGAGVNKPNRIEMTNPQSVLKEIGPKVKGILNLCSIFQLKELKFLSAFTSIIGVTGMPGNSWYAFSNELVNNILHQFKEENSKTETLTYAYSVWDEIGMGAKLGSVKNLAKMGIEAIPPQEGIQHFLYFMKNNPQHQQVIIAAQLGNLDTWNIDRKISILKNARFLEETISYTLNKEALFRAYLSIDKDLYVNDHVYNGSFLFPTVFGLEAMAEAVLAVIGKDQFKQVRIENIELKRPITVHPQKGAQILISAKVNEKSKNSNQLTISTGITKEDMGINDYFFSADFIIDFDHKHEFYSHLDDLKMSNKTSNIIPKRDLYKQSLLFQGTSFQQIQNIIDIKIPERKIIFTTQCSNGLDNIKKSFKDAHKYKLFLGDPYTRDTLLQSTQILLPQESSLPIKISAINIFNIPESNQEFMAQNIIFKMDEKDRKSNVIQFTSDGSIVESFEEYTVRKLKEMPNNPTIEELCKIQPMALPSTGKVKYQAGEIIQVHPNLKSFSLDLPVTFKQASQLGRTVNFGDFALWAGHLREMGLWPILSKLAEDMKGGKIGAVTNYTKLYHLGEATTGDIVTGRLTTLGLEGTNNSTLNIVMEFLKKGTSEKEYQRLAIMHQQTTMVEILGHGMVKAIPNPDYFNEFLSDLLPKNGIKFEDYPLSKYKETMKGLHNSFISDETVYLNKSPVIKEEIFSKKFETSLTDANLVGNIYYANYTLWQNKTRDHFIYSISPSLFKGIGTDGEIFCLENKINHLREAMPFDTIKVSLSIRSFGKYSMELHFDFFKDNDQSLPEKLATGYQKIIFAKRDQLGNLIPEFFPNSISQYISSKIEK